MPAKANLSEMELRARALYDAQVHEAKELAKAMADEPLVDAAEPSDEEVAEAWNFSREPDPASSFWALVEMATIGGMPREQAEELALREVYPARADLLGLGVFPLEIQVKRAERCARIAKRIADGSGRREAVTY
jgi:hypothetical protein